MWKALNNDDFGDWRNGSLGLDPTFERNKALQMPRPVKRQKEASHAAQGVQFQFAERGTRAQDSITVELYTSYTGRVSRVVELLQGKWTVQILCAMRTRPVRLSELRRAIPPASKKALTASLRSLEAAPSFYD